MRKIMSCFVFIFYMYLCVACRRDKEAPVLNKIIREPGKIKAFSLLKNSDKFLDCSILDDSVVKTINLLLGEAPRSHSYFVAKLKNNVYKEIQIKSVSIPYDRLYFENLGICSSIIINNNLLLFIGNSDGNDTDYEDITSFYLFNVDYNSYKKSNLHGGVMRSGLTKSFNLPLSSSMLFCKKTNFQD